MVSDALIRIVPVAVWLISFQFVFRRFQLSERALDDVEYLLAALFGKFHAAVRAVEQRRIQLPFQLFDRLRDRRLADKKFLPPRASDCRTSRR